MVLMKIKPPVLEQQYFGVRDSAHFLGVSEQFIYNFTSKKSKKPCAIPFKRIGGKILFSIRDLEKI
jgi:hypothetical protein